MQWAKLKVKASFCFLPFHMQWIDLLRLTRSDFENGIDVFGTCSRIFPLKLFHGPIHPPTSLLLPLISRMPIIQRNFRSGNALRQRILLQIAKTTAVVYLLEALFLWSHFAPIVLWASAKPNYYTYVCAYLLQSNCGKERNTYNMCCWFFYPQGCEREKW